MDQAGSTLSRRDRKKHATRQAIVEAALDLFETQGFSHTTVDEITERADVAQRTFFRHFATKEAVLFPDSDEGSAMFREALAGRPAGEPLLASALGAFSLAMENIAQEDMDLSARRSAILEQEGASGDAITWTSILAGHRIIEEAVAERAGLPVTDEQVQMVASTALLLMTQAVTEWYTSGSGADLATILDHKLERLRNLLEPSPEGSP